MSRFLICVFMVSVLAKHSFADDWPRFRGPSFTGVSAETIDVDAMSKSDARIRWKRSVGLGLSNVVVAEGRLFTMGNEDNIDTVVCLDANTGDSIWSHSYPCATDPNEFDGGPTSTPTVDSASGVVFTLSRSGDLFCFDAKSGDVRWEQNIAETANVRIPAWGFSGSPLVSGDRVLLNVGDAGVAVNRQSGELVWSSEDKDAGYSSMVPFRSGERDTVIFGSARSYVCVDPKGGTELWRQRWLTTFGCNAADPIVFGDHVFLSSGYNRGAALLAVAGEEPEVLWKSKEMQNQLSSSILIDAYLYGIHGDVDAGASLRCIDARDGSIKWTSEGINFGALSATEKYLIALSDDGELCIAKATPDHFELVVQQVVLDEKSWTAPVLANGRLYCRDGRGDLICLDVGQ